MTQVGTSPGSGVYCIRVNSCEPDAVHARARRRATVDYFEDDTTWNPKGSQAFVDWYSPTANDCPAGDLMVVTGVRTVTASGTGDNDVHVVQNTESPEGFFFIVP